MKKFRKYSLPIVLCCFMAASCSSQNKSADEDLDNFIDSLELPEDEIILYFRSPSHGYQPYFDNVFFENGYTYFFLKGDCRYWAFWSVKPDGRSGNWNDIFSGKLDESECRSIKKDLKVGRFENRCRNYYVYPDYTDGGGRLELSDGKGALACNIECPNAEDEQLMKSAWNWLARLLEQGSPVHDKLRGMLIVDRRPNSLLNYAEISDELKKYALNDDDLMYAFCFEGCGYPYLDPGETIGKTMVFSDEVQDELWTLREQRQQEVFRPVAPGIPLKDADGQKYQLFLRPAIELEDENGIIQPPTCDEWEHFFSVP